jgi:hypothetical protein
MFNTCKIRRLKTGVEFCMQFARTVSIMRVTDERISLFECEIQEKKYFYTYISLIQAIFIGTNGNFQHEYRENREYPLTGTRAY